MREKSILLVNYDKKIFSRFSVVSHLFIFILFLFIFIDPLQFQ